MRIQRGSYSSRLYYAFALFISMMCAGCGASMRSEPASATAPSYPQSEGKDQAAPSELAESEAAPPAPTTKSESLVAGLASTSTALTHLAPASGRLADNKSIPSNSASSDEARPSARHRATSIAGKEAFAEKSESEVTAEAVRAPLLIYRADIILAVFEVNKGLDVVEKIARDAKGYLVSRRDDSVTVRVPATGFDGSLQAVLKLGDVLQRNLQVDDVTAEMNDLTTRLKNAEAMRARFEQLLSSAKTTEEALKVEEQLGRITGEIESIKGKLRLMSELVAFSTITVSFRPVVSDKVNSKFKLPFTWLNDLGLSKLLSL